MEGWRWDGGKDEAGWFWYPPFLFAALTGGQEKTEEGLEGIKPQLQLLYVHNSNIVDTNDNAWG